LSLLNWHPLLSVGIGTVTAAIQSSPDSLDGFFTVSKGGSSSDGIDGFFADDKGRQRILDHPGLTRSVSRSTEFGCALATSLMSVHMIDAVSDIVSSQPVMFGRKLALYANTVCNRTRGCCREPAMDLECALAPFYDSVLLVCIATLG